MVSALLSLFADSIYVSRNCIPATVVTKTKLINGISISKGLGKNKTPFVNELRRRLHQSWFPEDWNHMKSVNAALSKKWRCFPNLFMKEKCLCLLSVDSWLCCFKNDYWLSHMWDWDTKYAQEACFIVFFARSYMFFIKQHTLPCFHSSSLHNFVYCFARTLGLTGGQHAIEGSPHAAVFAAWTVLTTGIRYQWGSWHG